MKLEASAIQSSDSTRRPRSRRFVLFLALIFLALPSRAHASFLHGETLDTVAGVIAWFAFILVPPVLIGAFLLVHILPEKVAEKRHHPQLGAIKCLCLLSLCFGGLLWPTRLALGLLKAGFSQDGVRHGCRSLARADRVRKNPPPVNSNNSAPASQNSKRRLKEGKRNGSHPAWHLRVLRLAHFL